MQKFNSTKMLLGVAVITSGLMCSNVVNAAAIIKYGSTYLGVNNEGHLNVDPFSIPDLSPEFSAEFGGNPVGLWREGLGDSTSPGCLCEGWGVAATSFDSRIAGFANEAAGTGGITGGTFGQTDVAITSQVNLSEADVTVTHSYGRSLAEGVFQASVTIANNTGSVLGDVVYRRAMDWDIPPTEFNEYVTHGGVEANLESNGGNVRYASDNGFASSDPRINAGYMRSETVNVDFVDNGPDDHGSVFDFAFGDIEVGASRTFNIFYGSAASETDAMNALSILNADVYSLGQQSGDPVDGTPATFLFAFGGVGGVEPGLTEDDPILPFVPAPGEFVFTTPEPRRWYDPPYAYGFDYELTGGALFTELVAPSAALGFGDIDLYVGGDFIASISPGESFDFTSLGFDVAAFTISGLGKYLDVAAPGFATAFPLFLDWIGTADELLMTALTVDVIPGTGPSDVPAPATLLLLLIAVASIARLNKVANRRAA